MMTLYTNDGRGGFTAYEVVSESRTHWTVGPHYDRRKVNKRTMESAKNWQGMNPRWYTQEQMEDESWKRANIRNIRSSLERADIATLRQIHALLGLPA